MSTRDDYRNSMSEVEWTSLVIALAEAEGWTVFHVPDWLWRSVYSAWQKVGTRSGQRWMMKGFPDLVLLRGRDLIVVELKTARGSTTPEQRQWLDGFAANRVEVHIWKPRDEDAIRARLARRGET